MDKNDLFFVPDDWLVPEDDLFIAFDEWSSEEDERAFSDLQLFF